MYQMDNDDYILPHSMKGIQDTCPAGWCTDIAIRNSYFNMLVHNGYIQFGSNFKSSQTCCPAYAPDGSFTITWCWGRIYGCNDGIISGTSIPNISQIKNSHKAYVMDSSVGSKYNHRQFYRVGPYWAGGGEWQGYAMGRHGLMCNVGFLDGSVESIKATDQDHHALARGQHLTSETTGSEYRTRWFFLE